MVAGVTSILLLARPGLSTETRKNVNWANGIVITLFSLLLCRRINQEEKMLIRELEPEYQTYTSRVKYRLIPGVF
ncbi:unnamed protein product [Sympodiomycopsis kandeliae]